MNNIEEIEVDGIISRRYVECDCGEDECRTMDHYPRALFEVMDDIGDHTREELDSGYCHHYNYREDVIVPSNGARWSDVMSDRESNNDKYVKRLDAYRLKQWRRYGR
jgi:hypothetical protein